MTDGVSPTIGRLIGLGPKHAENRRPGSRQARLHGAGQASAEPCVHRPADIRKVGTPGHELLTDGPQLLLAYQATRWGSGRVCCLFNRIVAS